MQPRLGFVLEIPSVLYAIFSGDDPDVLQFSCDVLHIVASYDLIASLLLLFNCPSEGIIKTH